MRKLPRELIPNKVSVLPSLKMTIFRKGFTLLQNPLPAKYTHCRHTNGKQRQTWGACAVPGKTFA